MVKPGKIKRQLLLVGSQLPVVVGAVDTITEPRTVVSGVKNYLPNAMMNLNSRRSP